MKACSERIANYKSTKEHLREREKKKKRPAAAFILAFQPVEQRGSKFLLFKPLVCAIFNGNAGWLIQRHYWKSKSMVKGRNLRSRDQEMI